MAEVIARGGWVIFLSDAQGAEKLGGMAEVTIALPAIGPFVAPVLHATPVQLLAYHTAVLKGTDVNQPKNLARSVAVKWGIAALPNGYVREGIRQFEATGSLLTTFTQS